MCSIFLPSDSVAVIGSFIAAVDVVEEPFGVVGLPSVVSIIVIGCVGAST
jgi:hypothetical protein